MPLFMHTPRIRFPVRAALRVMVAALVFLIPGLVLMGGPTALTDLTLYEHFWELPLRILVVFALSWKWIWTYGSSIQILLTLLLLFCGIWAWRLLGASRYAARSQS